MPSPIPDNDVPSGSVRPLGRIALSHYRPEDFAPMFRAMGLRVSVANGLGSTYGLVDLPEVPILPGEGSTSSGQDLRVTVLTGSLGDLLVPGIDITVDDRMFVVRAVDGIEDGAVTVISCAVKVN